MTLPIKFENHLQVRVMEVTFPEGYVIATDSDLQALKREWMGALRMWHSPYTLLFDARNFRIEAPMQAPFDKLVSFFKGFFMKRIVGFTDEGAAAPEGLPFPVFAGYETAAKETGLGREGSLRRDLGDLRSRIVIENDFTAHVMEVSFLAETKLETDSDVEVLKSKLTNILMQWHSPYSVVFNCANLHFSKEAIASFAKVERFLKGFFCKTILGYSPPREAGKEAYPFRTFLARHLAVAQLQNEGLVSGDTANCSTRGALQSSKKQDKP
jgi:hypothetical protein